MYQENIRASVYMMLAMAGFTLNDALVKSIDEAIGIGQIIFVRGVIATGLLILLHLITEQRKTSQAKRLVDVAATEKNGNKSALQCRSSWHGVLHPMVLGRGLFDVAATLAFLIALVQLPLAELSAILQALPLAVTFGAVLFLGEVVGWRRWLAILVGFGGVLIIIRPGMAGFSGYSLLALIAVIAAAARDIVTRRVPESIPSLLISVVTSAMVCVAGAALMFLSVGWVDLGAELLFKLVCAGAFVIAGYYFVILAMRTGEISFIAPFRYTSLVWAIGLGYAWFGELPDLPMVIGSILVVGTGLYTFHRERRLQNS